MPDPLNDGYHRSLTPWGFSGGSRRTSYGYGNYRGGQRSNWGNRAKEGLTWAYLIRRALRQGKIHWINRASRPTRRWMLRQIFRAHKRTGQGAFRRSMILNRISPRIIRAGYGRAAGIMDDLPETVLPWIVNHLPDPIPAWGRNTGGSRMARFYPRRRRWWSFAPRRRRSYRSRFSYRRRRY